MDYTGQISPSDIQRVSGSNLGLGTSYPKVFYDIP
jgi:hypothetical protein